MLGTAFEINLACTYNQKQLIILSPKQKPGKLKHAKAHKFTDILNVQIFLNSKTQWQTFSYKRTKKDL